MDYNKMTKKELIEELQRRDKENNQNTKSEKTISFKIINFREVESWTKIELLWTNNTPRNIHFIKGTLKFYDINKNLLFVDDKHICDRLNSYSEKAYVIEYLTRKDPKLTEATNVQITMTNVYDY